MWPFNIFHLGMAFGLFLSAICPTENAALQAAVAAFYPTILLSGKLASPTSRDGPNIHHTKSRIYSVIQILLIDFS